MKNHSLQKKSKGFLKIKYKRKKQKGKWLYPQR